MHQVIGTWESGGARVAGTYRVVLPVRLQNTAGDLVHHKGLYASGSLNTTDLDEPSLDVDVPASDDPDLTPQDWQTTIQVAFATGGREIYTIPTPDGDSTDLSDVVLPQELGDPEPVLIRGVPGGLAVLDEDGLVPTSQLPAGFGSGGTAYTFSSLATWPITHSLGRLPIVAVYVAGQEVTTDVDATTSSVTVTFPAPTSGVAVLA